MIVGAGLTARARGRPVPARPGGQCASIAAGRAGGPPLRSAIAGVPASAGGFGPIVGVTAAPACADVCVIPARRDVCIIQAGADGSIVAAGRGGRIIPARGGGLGVIIGAGLTARARGRIITARPGGQCASIAAGPACGPPLRSAITGVRCAGGFGPIVGTAARSGRSSPSSRPTRTAASSWAALVAASSRPAAR